MAESGRIVLFTLLIFQALLLCHCDSSMYSRERNELKQKLDMKKDLDIKMPFRMQKINLVWHKGMKKLTDPELERLYIDLKMQDKLELEVKKFKVDGMDEDGEHEALAREKLREILIKHGLADHFHDPDTNETWLKEKSNDRENDHMLKMDKKLSKLWKKAQLSGFSDEELNQLKKEFLHHQQKMDEYEELKNEIDAFDGISDNSLDAFKKSEFDLKDRKEKTQELKSKYHDMRDDYERLRRLSEAPSSEYEFTDPKVIDLWLLAKKANFTAEELDSLKVELAHYEHKRRKHEHYQDQVRMSRDSMKSPGKQNHLPYKHEELERQANEYGARVKKYHRELKTKIGKALGRHSEL